MCMESSGLGSAFTGRVKRGGKDVNQNRGHPREAKARPGGGYPEAQNEVLSRVLSGGGATRETQRRSGLPPPAAPNALAVREGTGEGAGELGFPLTLGPQSSPSLEEGLVRRLPWGTPGEPNSLCDLVRVQVGTPHCSPQANTPFPLPAPGLFLLCKMRRPILPATSTPSLFKHIRTSSVSQRLPAQSQVGGRSDGL